MEEHIMIINGKNQRALWFKDNILTLIDQRKLPYTYELFHAKTVDDVAFAIREMVVRGAPAIGAAAAYGMVIGRDDIEKTANILGKTRPTAHDLFYVIEYMKRNYKNKTSAQEAADKYTEDIIIRCKKIGEHGNKLLKEGMKILTHCNAGALATVDWGTALAPFRIAKRKGKEIFVFADETRPRLQGLLTAWELQHEEIPHALIVDNAAGYFMKHGEINMVITGADCITKNGDAANKIGTYEKAVLAKENDIPFYIAAPISTFNKELSTGEDIIIEHRSDLEITHINNHRVVQDGVTVKNPAFDVTPREYITGYITEEGIIKL
jgi:translation initiation factor eIF-2B subunit alpha/methylthioribose-1-phosphate isomerase